MEKKKLTARNGQNNSDFYAKKNTQDVSSKQQYPRRRKKEGGGSEFGNNKQRYNNNSNNSNNFYFEKRPQARSGGGGGGNRVGDQANANGAKSASETARLTEDLGGEFNSVYNHGSKKQNLNHLLNFHKYTKESDGYNGAFSKHGYHGYRSKRYNFNKEQYLQANCQFIVKEDAQFDYRPFKISPDTLVEWDQVVKVIISSCEESQCPICLYPPKAAKMTKCGHIYCYSCMLHYLSLSDKLWRKCPICYESVQLKDLKSSSTKHIHQSYKVGDIISLDLMKREKGSLFVNKANEIVENITNDFPNFSNVDEKMFTFSKLIMANKKEMLEIIERERNELEFQLAEDGFDCPESIFVQQAIELLNNKRTELERMMIDEKSKGPLTAEALSMLQTQPQNGLDVAESVSSLSVASEDDLIDEDCDLTVDDIDITNTASSNIKHFCYYQAPNGQNIFLHSMNSKMLQLMYGSLEQSPQTIRGKIVQITCCTMNEDLRKRLRYLQHLPVSSVFEVVELEFSHGIISKDVFDIFKDDLFQRRKRRQRREREEKKRERTINELNDRQMGKMLSSTSMSIDIGSTSQFPEYEHHDLPALASSETPSKSSSAAGPSYSKMLATTTAQKSANLWPSLSSNKSSPSTSFFGDAKKIVHIASAPLKECNESGTDDDEENEGKAPAYKNSLSDALAKALSLNENMPVASGKKSKKKAKKTLLFSSGMNFN